MWKFLLVWEHAAWPSSEVHNPIAHLALQVEAIAKELQQCHRSQQPAVAAQLRDARQQLQQQQAAATALGAEVGQLNQVAQQAAEQVERAQQALSSSRAQVDAALAARSLLQQEISELMQVRWGWAVGLLLMADCKGDNKRGGALFQTGQSFRGDG